MIKLFPLIVLLSFFAGCAYTSLGQNKASYDLMQEQRRRLELDNQIKAEQLKQMQLQRAELEAKTADEFLT